MMEYICTQEEESREDITRCTTTTFKEAADGKLNLTLNCTTHFYFAIYDLKKNRKNEKYFQQKYQRCLSSYECNVLALLNT